MAIIQTKKNSVHAIFNIFFVPKLIINLLSIGHLQEKNGIEFISEIEYIELEMIN
jgi:hypothetical protein